MSNRLGRAVNDQQPTDTTIVDCFEDQSRVIGEHNFLPRRESVERRMAAVEVSDVKHEEVRVVAPDAGGVVGEVRHHTQLNDQGGADASDGAVHDQADAIARVPAGKQVAISPWTVADVDSEVRLTKLERRVHGVDRRSSIVTAPQNVKNLPDWGRP